MKNISYLVCLLVFSAILCTGCGPKRPPLSKVEGTVTYHGEPVANGSITFDVTGGRPATGKIVDGKIVDVTTFERGDGVSIGTAQIAITATEKVEEERVTTTGNPGESAGGLPANYMGMGGKSLIPPHYNKPSTSNLTTKIEKGKVNTITLVLE